MVLAIERGIHMKQIIKKAISAVICGGLLLSLAACGGNKNTSNNISNSNNSNITTSNDIETKEYNAYKSNGKIVDLLTVEEVNINPFTVATVDNAEFFQWRMKVRNTSGKDLVKDTTSMRIWYNYLDENKDKAENIFVFWLAYLRDIILMQSQAPNMIINIDKKDTLRQLAAKYDTDYLMNMSIMEISMY